MSLILPSKEVCERALRKIGSFSINDVAADPEELAESLYWLDMLVAQFVGLRRVPWLVQATFSFALTANTASYDLETAIGASYPDDGIVSFLSAWIRDSSGLDDPIKLLRRAEYEAISDKDSSGTPDFVYIDRLGTPTAYVNPVPANTGYSLRLVAQSYAPDLTKNSGNNAHGFAAEWNMFLVLGTAALIGDGPVRKLPATEVDRIKVAAGTLEKKLVAYALPERVGPRRTKRWGF